MEDMMIPPVLNSLREVRLQISSGHSMKQALSIYIEGASGEWGRLLRDWWILKQQGGATEKIVSQIKSRYRISFLEIIERGLRGEPTLPALTALEEEVERAANMELEAHISTLPIKILVPLLVFQFPAYLILLLMPLLRDLSGKMGG